MTQTNTPLWAQSQRWLTFAEQLIRYYTNRAGRSAWTLHLLHPSSEVTAYAQNSTRTIGLNPLFPHASGRLQAFHAGPQSERDRTETHLRAYLAHEAGHVRFSCARPGDTLLGQVWNRLEDERIERLMQARHPELARAFTEVGDVHLQRFADQHPQGMQDMDLLDWALVWRWGHDHPLCNDRPADARWADVRPLVEAAWMAASSEEVISLSLAILNLLGRDPQEGAKDPETSATGGGSAQREEQPGTTPAPREPGGNEDGNASDEGSGAGEDEGSGAGERESGGAGENEDGDGENAGSGAGGDTQTKDPSGTPDPGTPDQGREEAPTNPQAPADLKRDAPPQNAPHAPTPPPTAGSGNEDAGGGAGTSPRLTRAAPGGVQFVHSHEALARDLSGLLEAKDRRGLETSHRSRGRFEYGRYARGDERWFRTRTQPTRQEPVRVTVLADVSASTATDWGEQPCSEGIRHATLALTRAGMLARQAAMVVTFDSRATVIADAGLGAGEAYSRVLAHHFQPDGGTQLAPALRLALARRTPGARHLVVVISDGAVTDQDECLHLLSRHLPPDVAFLPLLVNTDARVLAAWQQLFRNARPARDVRELGQIARNMLTHLQDGPWRAPLNSQ